MLKVLIELIELIELIGKRAYIAVSRELLMLVFLIPKTVILSVKKNPVFILSPDSTLHSVTLRMILLKQLLNIFLIFNFKIIFHNPALSA